MIQNEFSAELGGAAKLVGPVESNPSKSKEYVKSGSELKCTNWGPGEALFNFETFLNPKRMSLAQRAQR